MAVVVTMQEKYGCKGKKLYFAFVDLEKAFDRVPREVTRCPEEGRSGGMVGEGSHGDEIWVYRQ